MITIREERSEEEVTLPTIGNGTARPKEERKGKEDK